jgi:hemerythrin-like domain-containing protein
VRSNEVRDLVCDEHSTLREMLDGIEHLSLQFEQGDERVGDTLREQGLALYQCFAAHLKMEDSVLGPALRDSGAEGQRAAKRLGHEHHEQQQLISYLLGRLDQQRAPTLLVARELRSFAEYLRLDMQHEETNLLPSLVPESG